MADRDSDSDTIIGRDSDADREPFAISGRDVVAQLAQTTVEDAGSNVSGSGTGDACADLDIVFEHEEDEETRH